MSNQYEKNKYTNREEAQHILEHMRQIAESKKDIRIWGKYHYYVANLGYIKGDLQAAYESALESISLLIQSPVCKELACCYNILGGSASARGDRLQALDCYIDGANYALDLADAEVVSIFYNNIALIYNGLHDYASGEEFLNRAYENMKDVGEGNQTRFIVCMNLVNTCTYCNKLVEAEQYLQEIKSSSVRQRTSRFEFDMKTMECYLLEAQGNTIESEEAFDDILHIMKQEKLDVHMFQMLIDLMRRRILTEDKEKILYVLSTLDAAIHCYQGVSKELEVCDLWCSFFERFDEKEHYSKATEQYHRLSRQRDEDIRKSLLEAAQAKFSLDQFMKKHKKVVEEADTLRQKVLHDSLTNLYSRSAMKTVFESKFEEARRVRESICVTIIDVDHFKKYNDTYGHPEGDKCLKTIASQMKKILTEDVLFMRWGGDEFLALFYGKSKEEAEDILKDLQERIKAPHMWKIEDDFGRACVTLTQGGYHSIPDSEETLNDFIRYADRALYQGKRTRNTIILHHNAV